MALLIFRPILSSLVGLSSSDSQNVTEVPIIKCMPGYKNFSFKISPLAEFVLCGSRLAVFKQTEYKNQF